MSHDRLEQLLRDADADEAPPPGDVNLAARVRSHAARERSVRAIGAAVAAAAACVVATGAWVTRPDAQRPAVPVVAHKPMTASPIVPKPTAVAERAEMLALAAEADRRAALAEAMWAAQRRPPRDHSSVLDPASQLERAAFTMVFQAARMPDGGGAASPAAGVYRQVWQTFPHTRSAAVARERLTELQNRKDG